MVTRVGPSGQYNALCDVCGFKYKNTELKKRWDGFMCCPDDWETRHPLDFFRSRQDVHSLPWTRPDNNGINVGPTYTYPPGPDYPPSGGPFCTPITNQPIADTGTADCATLTI